MNYDHLNHYISPSAAEGLSDAWRRSLARLGDYTAILVRSLNLRPLAVKLHAQTAEHILVRISLPSSHLILRVAPEDDLAAYVYLIRALSGNNIPAPKIIQRDLSRGLVPFAFTLESYVPGISAEKLPVGPLLRGAGRQAGRALRRMHRISVSSAGRPTATGRWLPQTWRSVLPKIGRRLTAPPFDSLIFSESRRNAVATLLTTPQLDCPHHALIHGRFGPQAIRCTSGEHVYLEAIVDPGYYIGGDPLYDIACGLIAAHPADWREGLIEGYLATGSLTPEEEERLLILQLLANYWEACRRYMYAEPHEAVYDEAIRLIDHLTLEAKVVGSSNSTLPVSPS